MRIALVNWSNRLVGGAETYIGTIAGPLAALGHDVALLSERDGPHDRENIPLPKVAVSWAAEDCGTENAIEQLRAWRPSVIYVNGLESHELGSHLAGTAPMVFICHNYNGLCISGLKTLSFPGNAPCQHLFDRSCIARFYPRRCGGLNPVTMSIDYRRQRRVLNLLERCRAVVTISEYMRTACLRQGLDADRAFAIPPPVAASQDSATSRSGPEGAPREGNRWNLLFLGRMDALKGGRVLLNATPLVAASLGKKLHVTFAGDGPERSSWEDHAGMISRRSSNIEFSFPGWIAQQKVSELLRGADLLVVPSLWPEPFGLVGLEAGLFGVPTAAFAVGGIPEWLREGKNGHLAANPPATPQGLAGAIVGCLSDPEHHKALCEGAAAVASGYTVERHVLALLDVFEGAIRG